MNQQTINILHQIFHTLSRAHSKSSKNKFSLTTNNKFLPFPPNLGIDSIPSDIKKFIFHNLHSTLTFNTHVESISVEVSFIITQKRITKALVSKYTSYFKDIVTWLTFVLKHALHNKVTTLHVCIYMTPLPKCLPNSGTIGPSNVNTAYTFPNVPAGEIIIYREEEWFKVFIHETMHTFGLDFSDVDNNACTMRMRRLFNVNSKINLFEAYTEFWARIMNILFVSFQSHPKSVILFTQMANKYLHRQSIFSVMQMVKILKYMGLTYDQIVSKVSQPKYKEATNVLSYYIICGVLFVNYQKTLAWCKTNNRGDIIQFTKTPNNQARFCNYIENEYMSPQMKNMLDNVLESDNLSLKMSII